MALRTRIAGFLKRWRVRREKRWQLRIAEVDERAAYDAEIAKANPYPYNSGGH